MTDTSTEYKLKHQIKSETIDIEALHNYSLHYLIKPHQMLCGVIDNSRGKYLLFEEYDMPDLMLEQRNYLDSINDIIDNHHLFKAGFWKNIRVSFQNEFFTLVPSGLYDSDSSMLYLSQSLDEENKDKMDAKGYKQLSVDAVNVFAAPKELISLFDGLYDKKKLDFIHETSAFIEACFRNQAIDQDNVFVSIDKEEFIMVIIQNGKLQLCNSFKYKTVNDLIYYLMFTIKESGLDNESLILTLWGEIAEQSKIYEGIYKYVRYVEIGKRPKHLKFPYHFDEILDQRHFTMFSQHLCE